MKGSALGAHKKPPPVPFWYAFENPLFKWGASGPGFGSHYQRVGLQAPDSNVGSLRELIGSSKVSYSHAHRRGFRSRLVTSSLLYHDKFGFARSARYSWNAFSDASPAMAY